jgi:hypothetical protein
MQPDLVQHPSEVKKTAHFFGWAAEGNGGHEKSLGVFRRGSRARKYLAI